MSTDGLRQPLSGGASIGGIDDSVEIYCFINQYVGMQMWWVHGPLIHYFHKLELHSTNFKKPCCPIECELSHWIDVF
jgi:hypothetical protein